VLTNRIRTDTESIKDKQNELEPYIKLTNRTIHEIQDQIETNHEIIFNEVDQVEEILFEVRTWQTEYNNYRYIEHQSLAEKITDNGDAIDNLQESIEGINDAITALEETQGNVIMDTMTVNFGSHTEAGLGIRAHQTYDSMRHVALTRYANVVKPGSSVSLYIALPNVDDPVFADILHYTDSGFHYYEFNTDEWYLYVGDNDFEPYVDCFLNIVTFKEA